MFRPHTAAQRWAAGMNAETPTLTGSDHALPCRCRDWGRDVPVIDRNTAVFTFVVAGAVSIGLAALEFFRGIAWLGKAWLGLARQGNAMQGKEKRRTLCPQLT